MKGRKNMTIELKYRNPRTGHIGHYFFPDLESDTALDYLEDASRCGYEILIWRLIPTDRIVVR